MKKILIVIGLQFLISSTVFASTFTDVDDTYPYKEAIEYAHTNGIVQGYDDGKFKPNELVNRAEFIKIFVGTNFTEDKIYGDNCFPDVKDEWFAKYVCTAKRKRIIEGSPDGNFNPGGKINLAEMAKIVSYDEDIETAESEHYWYENYVRYLTKQRAIPTTLDCIYTNVHRGEVAEIVYRLRKNLTDRDTYFYGTNGKTCFSFYSFNGGVYIGNASNIGNRSLLEGIDHKTFEILNYPYSSMDSSYKDKNNIYFEYKKVNGADLDSFEILSAYTAKDKNTCYREEGIGIAIEAVECEGILLGDGYKQINDDIFYHDFKIERCDVETFKNLGLGYAKDKNNVYYDGKILIESDSATFKGLGGGYFKDKNNVYFRRYKLKDADATTFETIIKHYAKDKNSVYYDERKLEGSDPETFSTYRIEFPMDKNNVYDYYGYKIENADPATFEGTDIPGGNYNKDKNAVYYWNAKIENSDPATFESLGSDYFKDKNNCYKEDVEKGPEVVDMKECEEYSK